MLDIRGWGRFGESALRPINRTVVRKASIVEVAVVMAGTLVLWQSCKFVAQVFAVVAIFAVMAAALIGNQKVILSYWIALGLWVGSLIVPVDVAVRSSDSFAVRFVRVFMTHGLRRAVLERETANGLSEGKDFVIYDCSRWPLISPKWALIVFLPVKSEAEPSE